MCGLTGYFNPAGLSTHEPTVLARMADRIAHRGPDGEGAWIDAAAGIALGHRRLAIIDLSDAGRQPMHSPSGRFVIAYNGEIYNHLELRAQLAAANAAPPWRGHSDTETLLAAVEFWGFQGALQRADGMFALALWDRERRELTLARDRIGEKPLYYGWQGQTLLFGSELKSLRAHPAFCAGIDVDSLGALLRWGYVPAPASIYQGIHKLMPGSSLTLGGAAAGSPEPVPYWSLRDVAARGQQQRFTGDDREATDRLEAELGRAVKAQTLSDVPLGAFLSGGTDSSMIVALLQAQSARKVRTFTIGFNEAEFQEAPHAAAVARHLGTDHSEWTVTPADAMHVIPTLPALYDEPFGDSSAIPTHLVSRYARQHVTVCLSGDGGDELFGGYSRYRDMIALWQRLGAVPAPLRRLVSGGTTLLSRGWRAHRTAGYLGACDIDAAYAVRTTQWLDASEVVRGASAASPAIPPLAGTGPMERMMFVDSIGYLPDDILAKVDRAAMAVSLETRIPLLDRQVVEFAWSLPLRFKVRDGRSKWLLRQVLSRYVPDAIMERPKMGFGVPVGEWMRGPLRAWVEDLLDRQRLEREGFFDAGKVRARWETHLSGRHDLADSLWPLLMFQSWRQDQSRPQAVVP
jgi:asparagine synthase (glutamine-hydrolysing)